MQNKQYYQDVVDILELNEMQFEANEMQVLIDYIFKEEDNG